MVALQCTKKLLDKLKTQYTDSPPPSDGKLGQWYVDVKIVQKKHYIVAFNPASYLTLILPYAAARKDFASEFRETL
ncbi:MAG: hypothetical protein SGJ05_04625 [bacterium]|nr:hypothetical protein [bacterium]